MKVQYDGPDIKVEGNTCKRGEQFARNEIISPMRSLTTTVRTVFKEFPVLPVRTDRDIPKALVLSAMKEINSITVSKKAVMGEYIIENILNTGANIIASCDIPCEERE
jgi:CxxC motif-containing protein